MLNILLKSYFLFLPLHVFGFEVGKYVFNIPTIISIIIVIVRVAEFSKFNIFELKIFIPLLLFITWSLLTVIYNDLGWSWIYSMGSLILMCLPAFFTYNSRHLSGLTKYIILGFILTIPFSIYDLSVTLFNVQPIGYGSDLFHFTQSAITGGYYRIRSTFDEPSFYAAYLCAVLNFIIGTKYQKNKYLFYSIIILLILTLSLTGYFLLVYLLYFHKRIKYKTKAKHVYVVVVLFVLYSSFFSSEVQHVYDRIINTYDSLLEYNVLGSEGSRINSLTVLFKYYQDDSSSILFGEGYSNHENWLEKKFEGYRDGPSVSFARGAIHNVFGGIGISTGVIGLILYLNIFVAMYRNRIVDKDSLILLILIQFSYSQIVGYLIWGIMLMFRYKKMCLPEFSQSNKGVLQLSRDRSLSERVPTGTEPLGCEND